MSHQTETYSQHLKRMTRKYHDANPKLGWAFARDQARAYLHDQLNKYPSTPAIMRNYAYQRKLMIGGWFKAAFEVFHAAPN